MDLCKKYSIILFVVLFLAIFAVEAFTASWIEIPIYVFKGTAGYVEAFTASWIEIPIPAITASA